MLEQRRRRGRRHRNRADRPRSEQLADFGIRQFELDVFADPDGGLYANRAANPVVGLPVESGEPALDEPGFKVLHTQDFDYATTCLTLVACLGEIDTWSADHPNHLPIVVLVELKSLSVPEAAAEEGIDLTIDLPWAVPVETTAEVLGALDAEVRSALSPERLLDPDEVRGDAASLTDAVEGIGWPELADTRGQVVVVLNDAGAQRDLYIADTPVLEGRPMFTSSTPGAPDAAFVRFDDPTDPSLDAATSAGYLIRTRTDSPTVDARENDTAKLDAALAGGAQYLSTDYYEPSTYFDSPYVVMLPGGAIARCNPVTAPASCSPELLAE
ncbi:Ca2+-dependent phosphoinositide-specific phospholipase C [Ilumatobacter sp.]|uniref:Ca2+-dependent phosphoinositide-specific phospholipase C n=1 Tax=Ilumatobacter sp. TaxID=1967498 RepID=UPI003C5BC110